MRLKKIKLSGFKSFVDTTTLPLISNLTGIVGPNGCGKSNIIDAVRWVLGESSAKNLRGGSIADVIFDGASQRAPLSQASVELIFDNSDGRVGGEYASYNEISIKRVIDREGVSSYYLNNSRCRRKDITHIFLGTGLGPRSYSIIEQGMISRFIDAKPEDMRSYIEEAAGISKYKERRRETELRIKHTIENLSRVNDLKEEVSKQLEKLKKQAKDAEKYHELKSEERTLKAQLAALKWQVIQSAIQTIQNSLKENEVALEGLRTEKTNCERELIERREKLHELNESYQDTYEVQYKINSELSKIEQSIELRHDQLEKINKELQQIAIDIEASSQHLESDHAIIESNKTKLLEINPQYEALSKTKEHSEELLNLIEQEKSSWEEGFRQNQIKMAEHQKHLSVEQVRQQQLNERKEDRSIRIQNLSEKLSVAYSSLPEQISVCEKNNLDINKQKEIIYNQWNKQKDERKVILQNIDAIERNLVEKQRKFHRYSIELATLKAHQLANEHEEAANDWLKNNQYEKLPRLFEEIQVEKGYEKAVETVLSHELKAICLDNLPLTKLNDFNMGYIEFIETKPAVEAIADQTLLSKLSPVYDVLVQNYSNVYIVDDIESGLQTLKNLPSNASVVTKQGVWFSHTWLRVNKQIYQGKSILERQQDIEYLNQNIQIITQEIDISEKELQQLKSQAAELEAIIQQQQNTYIQIEARCKEQEIELLMLKQQQAQWEKDRSENEKQLFQLEEELVDLNNKIINSQAQVNLSTEELTKLQTEQTILNNEKRILDEKWLKYKEEAQIISKKHHEHAILVHSLKAEMTSLQQNKGRLEIHIVNLKDRKVDLEKTLKSIEDTKPLQDSLQQKLEEKMLIEKELSHIRENLQSQDEEVNSLENKRVQIDFKINEMNQKIQALNLELEGHKVRQESINEQLNQEEIILNDIIQAMPNDANEIEWSERLQSVSSRITKLGAINLAAIDEFKTESERMQYLEQQYNDLTEALQTLEQAMRKIDQETKSRFKETYDQINLHFQKLFPKMFGGGHACLELTHDDLLQTGIQIVAKPPGKKVSNISALSGGEKALTAVALVLSIFQLNPSPFCMLDEVDAPLDDTNVARFCKVIKEMSKDVQFIFITHNKITMELAEQLSGVTMKEPGVSRLVSVDIEQAVMHATH